MSVVCWKLCRLENLIGKHDRRRIIIGSGIRVTSCFEIIVHCCLSFFLQIILLQIFLIFLRLRIRLKYAQIFGYFLLRYAYKLHFYKNVVFIFAVLDIKWLLIKFLVCFYRYKTFTISPFWKKYKIKLRKH